MLFVASGIHALESLTIPINSPSNPTLLHIHVLIQSKNMEKLAKLQTMKAITIVKDGEGQKAELQDVSLPTLRDDYVLCKVKTVALNPTDWFVSGILRSFAALFEY